MPTQRFPTSDIQGFTPAVEPTVSDKIFALSGRNYVFDSSGPKSPFGNRILTPRPRVRKDHMQGFRLKLQAANKVFHIDGDGIWEWSEQYGTYLLVYATPNTTTSPYRWATGYLAGYLFMCHPSVGILCYNLDTGICVPHELIGLATPTQPLSLVVNNGRLIVVTPDFYYWSAPSNGLDFTPSLGGAGFQLISERVSGDVICVTGYTKGTLTWTTGGVMRSVFAGDAAVYQHRALYTDFRPVNSFCTCRIDDDTTVILDERGLFKSVGEAPVAYAPLFNEFLIDYIKQNKLTIGTNLRIDWDELSRMLYVSTSTSYSDSAFEMTFAYYPPMDKWGQFNERHYGLFPILIESSEREGNYFGFCDTQGRVRYWRETGSRELRPELCVNTATANLMSPLVQAPSQPIFGYPGSVMPSSFRLNTVPTTGYARDGYYVDGTTALVTPELTGLNAQVRFGLYRPTGPSAVDEASEVLNVLVRSVFSGNPGQASLDYNLIPSGTSDEDYELQVGQEDFGFNPENYINSQLRMIGTIDGHTEYMSATPDLVQFTRGARLYSCSVIGIWHIAEVTASNIGDSFHISAFEITAASAGRLL